MAETANAGGAWSGSDERGTSENGGEAQQTLAKGSEGPPVLMPGSTSPDLQCSAPETMQDQLGILPMLDELVSTFLVNSNDGHPLIPI